MDKFYYMLFFFCLVYIAREKEILYKGGSPKMVLHGLL